MTVQKVWTVTSGNPRPSHAEIDGETQDFPDPFSNGLYFPGDAANGDASEVANCSCVLAIEGEVDQQTEAPVEVDLESLKPDVAGSITDQVTGLMDQWQSPLEKIDTADLSNRGSEFAEYFDGTNTMTFDANLLNAPDLDELYWSPEGFRVRGELDAAQTIATHEFGHGVAEQLTAEQWREIASQVNETTGQPILAPEHPWQMLLDSSEATSAQLADVEARDNMVSYLKENLSRYASNNGHEFMAEAFTEYTTAASPRPIAQLVGNYLRDLFAS